METSIDIAVQFLTSAEERNGARFTQMLAVTQESQEQRE
jgi:hypothetical protein